MRTYNAKRGTFTLTDQPTSVSAPLEAAADSNELDVYASTMKATPNGPADIAQGDYVLVVGRLRQGKSSPKLSLVGQGGHEDGGSQSGRLGITAHKVRDSTHLPTSGGGKGKSPPPVPQSE